MNLKNIHRLMSGIFLMVQDKYQTPLTTVEAFRTDLWFLKEGSHLAHKAGFDAMQVVSVIKQDLFRCLQDVKSPVAIMNKDGELTITTEIKFRELDFRMDATVELGNWIRLLTEEIREQVNADTKSLEVDFKVTLAEAGHIKLDEFIVKVAGQAVGIPNPNPVADMMEDLVKAKRLRIKDSMSVFMDKDGFGVRTFTNSTELTSAAYQKWDCGITTINLA